MHTTIVLTYRTVHYSLHEYTLATHFSGTWREIAHIHAVRSFIS